LLIAAVELAEAEGRSLRQSTIDVGFLIALMWIAGMLVIAGAVVAGWGLYQYLTTMVSAAVAALVVGAVALVIGGGALWQIRRSCR